MSGESVMTEVTSVAVKDSELGRAFDSVHAVDVSDLPIPRVEIELASADDELLPVGGWQDASRVMALVRLHGHPLGVLFLDGRLGPSRRAHAAGIWTALQHRVNAHLADDGYPVAQHLDDLVVSRKPEPPACERRRDAVLSRPPRISVVVATRDRPESLRACLKSLLDTTYGNFEIVVVDNDPTNDDTADMLAAEFDSVRYVREYRRGLASAHNCGLDVAQGRIVAFVDDDVLVDQHWMTAIAQGFAETDDVGCVTGLILPEQLETPAQLLLEHRGGYGKGFDLKVFDTRENRPGDPLFPFAAGQLGSGANMAFDAEMLRGMGGFDVALGVGTRARGGDDMSGFFRTIVAGHRLVYQPGAIVWHRHYRDMAALRNMARGCGVGMGAYLASSLVHEPRMIIDLARCLPEAFAKAFLPQAPTSAERPHPWPVELVNVERRGLLAGPAAYAVSRWRTRRATAAATRQLRSAKRCDG
ncbi:glycosyltransferase [Mycolicibacterium sp.]|uniref:glycosyltransferase family 2 protein n=1 Tax=Mycolicibacterium sp. TaxID=2320850 RepID=UPI001A1823A8|nr:glycosyltransferase [Mycolicibacterium sp.]MBJ7337655.1 glycosyltransferase [Mycolicibacterium sp.]